LTAQELLKTADELEKSAARFAETRFTIGLDGFVDEILHAVNTRKSRSEFERIQTITEFSDRVRSAAGKSANIEMVPVQVKPGGNGPLMSMAVAGMGGKVTCIGLLGYPHVLPVFKPLEEKASLISIGNPGRTDALEFRDGKLMLGKLNTISEMCWKGLQDVIGDDRLRSLILDADLTACTNWTMLTEMDEILENIIAMVPAGSKARFFFDLADPEKRDSKDLERVIDQIRRLNKNARCILGLNLREAEQVCHVLGIQEMPIEEVQSVKDTARRIAEKLNLNGVVVHAIRCAGSCLDGASAGIAGPYCANPKLSTGAGDHFNGGFVSGIMSGLDVAGALYSGVGTSGWYVRNARSPERSDVIQFLRNWARGIALD
jgi:hypothetical protein